MIAGTAAAVVVVDQLTKTWALRALADESIHLFWTLRLKLTINPGAAFGIGRGLGPVLVVAAVAVLVVLLMMARSTSLSAVGTVALGLVLGGALGNLVDRLVRDQGGVVDFVDFQWWPAFNAADAAITVGAVLLVFTMREQPEA